MSRAGQGQFAPAMTDREPLIHSKAVFLHKQHENQQTYIMVHDSLPQAQSVKHGTLSIIKLNIMSYNNNSITKYDPNKDLKISQRLNVKNINTCPSCM